MKPAKTQVVIFSIGFMLLGAFAPRLASAEADGGVQTDPTLGTQGVNLGNTLEAPREGQWGLTLKKEYFELIRRAGFDFVRLPIRWNAYAAQDKPYTLSPGIFKRVDWAIEQALKNDLAIVINIHHYNALVQNPREHKERFLAIWRQIARHYRDRPETVYFELLNEPHDPLTAEIWNELIPEALEVIRETNPDRKVVIGPVQWNAYSKLPELKLPKDDRNLMVTFHYYLPFHFTHQGASWVDGSDEWLGTTWTATEEQKREIKGHFDRVVEWSREHRRPVLLGEFGAYSRADSDSRVRWTTYVREQAEHRGFSWAYWEFGAGFGFYDPDNETWRKELLKALIPDSRFVEE
jgi:endoglucanase